MKEEMLTILGELATSDLNGDCIRIALYIASTNRSCRVIDIQNALGLRKENVSRYCKLLYEKQFLDKFTYVVNTSNRKYAYPSYSFNWNRNYTNSIQKTDGGI